MILSSHFCFYSISELVSHVVATAFLNSLQKVLVCTEIYKVMREINLIKGFHLRKTEIPKENNKLMALYHFSSSPEIYVFCTIHRKHLGKNVIQYLTEISNR